MKSIVTGGAGFIGSNLVKRLVSEGHDVVVLDNLRRGNKLDKDTMGSVDLIVGDVRDEDVVQKSVRGCDLIFHFAAILGVDIVADNPVETMDTEVIGLKNVMNAAIRHGIEKTIYASTSGVYGKAAIERAVDEEFHVSPSSSYSISKRYCEIYLKSLYQEKNIQSISLRFFNVYGTNQDNRMVIPRFFGQAINNESITVYGNGDQTRDFTYIDDVVEAIIQVANVAKGCEIINISNSREFAIKDLAKEIVKICESKSEIIFTNPGSNRYDFEVERRYGSSQKLFAITGFKPNTPLQIGLRKTLEYIKTKSKQ